MLEVLDRTDGCPKSETVTFLLLSGTSVAVGQCLATAAALIRRDHEQWQASSQNMTYNNTERLTSSLTCEGDSRLCSGAPVECVPDGDWTEMHTVKSSPGDSCE